MAKEIKQKIVLEGEKEYSAALKEANRNLKTLRSELNTSKERLTKAEESFRNANLFLEKCAAEEKKSRLKIKAQRNTWAAVAACLVVALAVK